MSSSSETVCWWLLSGFLLTLDLCSVVVLLFVLTSTLLLHQVVWENSARSSSPSCTQAGKYNLPNLNILSVMSLDISRTFPFCGKIPSVGVTFVEIQQETLRHLEVNRRWCVTMVMEATYDGQLSLVLETRRSSYLFPPPVLHVPINNVLILDSSSFSDHHSSSSTLKKKVVTSQDNWDLRHTLNIIK